MRTKNMSIRNKNILKGAGIVLGIAGIALGLSFIYLGAQASESTDVTQAPQAMPVETVTVDLEKTKIWKEFSGRLTAVDYVELRPQVSGRVTEIRFQDGQNVNQGDILYVIDPRPYQAAYDQAKAELEAAKTKSVLAEKEYQRAKSLIGSDAISKKVLDERSNERLIAASQVQSLIARVERAQVDLDYAFVKAPVSGRVGRAEVTLGNLVQTAPNAPVLTTIVSNNGVYADFEVDEQTYLKYVHEKANIQQGESKIPVQISLLNDNKSYNGHIESFDNRINPESGTIRARAFFKNEDSSLLPGMTISVKMGSAGEEERILISERAIGTDQDRKFVYIVTPENKAAYREVKLGESIEGKRVITAGLQKGDQVIVEGTMRVHPEMSVAPMETKQTSVINQAENESAKGPSDDLGDPPQEKAQEIVPLNGEKK